MICQTLQKVHQGFCTDGQAFNIFNPSQGKVWMDCNKPYSINDAEGSHYTGPCLTLPWSSKEIHSTHRCIRWCVLSTTITGIWWNQILNSILISCILWNTKEVEYLRTGSLQSILHHYQMELLPPRSWYHHLQWPQITSQIPKWKEC